MPKYFKSKESMLYHEAFASFLIIENLIAQSIKNGMISDKLARVYENAHVRVYRRRLRK
jgi:hypothetical protein